MKYQTNFRSKFEDDENEIVNGSLQMYNKPIVCNSVDVYLDGPIVELSYYRNLMHYLRQMEDTDELRIWIDTNGGYLDTTMALIDGIKNSEGDVTCIVSGKAHSAGGLLALAAPSLLIGENCSFMCHTASWGPGIGKHNNIVESVNYTTAQVNNLVKKYYKHFLSDTEIEAMLNGKDFWFDAEESKKRLEFRAEALRMEAEPKVEKPKRKSKVTTPNKTD